MSLLAKCCCSSLLLSCVGALIVPEEISQVWNIIMTNIPRIKKGTDSRVGIGFRLSDHADFQVLLELGPQTKTRTVGPAENVKKQRQCQQPVFVVQPVIGTKTVADTPLRKWLSSWHSTLVKS